MKPETPQKPTASGNGPDLNGVPALHSHSDGPETYRGNRDKLEEELGAHELWLAAQREAFKATVEDAPLETCLEPLVRTATARMGEGVRVAFYLANPEGTALHHVVGMDPGFAKVVDGFKIGPDSLSCGLAMHTGKAILTSDVRKEPLWKPLLNVSDEFGFRGCWSFPIRTGTGKFVGAFAVYWKEPHEATSEEREFAELVAETAALIISRKLAEEALRKSEANLKIELADSKRLQAISAEIVFEPRVEALYEKLVDAAAAIMRSDFAGLQMFYPERGDGELRLLAHRGFAPEMAKTFEWVSPLTGSSCGLALGRNSRVVLPDLEHCDSLNSEARAIFRAAGIRAAQSTPLFSRNGQILGMISTHWKTAHQPPERDFALFDILARLAADVIERLQVEENSARLAAIVEQSEDAMVTKDLDGIIRTWNGGAERLFGYTADEVIGKPITILFPPDRLDEEPKILEQIQKGGRIDHFDTVRRRKDGTLVNISLAVSPIRDRNGNLLGASKVARDITEKVRSRELLEQTVAERTASLREAVEQMEEFSYSVAHDLRAPLRAMTAYAEVLLQDYGSRLDETGRGYVEKIRRASDRMSRLTQDVLSYSRIARSELKPGPVILDRLVKDILHQYSYLQPPAAMIEIVSPLLDVLGNEPILGQCITNLFNNAVKFITPGVTPKIRIWTEPRGENVRIWVEDNGIGIKPQHQERIFQMFERVHPEGKYEGTGIGLTIVRKAAERMMGKAGVESDGQNGSRFWIELRSA